jgi:hypothetical protein
MAFKPISLGGMSLIVSDAESESDKPVVGGRNPLTRRAVQANKMPSQKVLWSGKRHMEKCKHTYRERPFAATDSSLDPPVESRAEERRRA